MELKEKLDILLKRKGYKKTDFAATLGITYRALANYINGSRFPRSSIINDMAILLDVDSELLTDSSINLVLTSEEKLYFYGSSDSETLDEADRLLSDIDKLLCNEKFTEKDKTSFFNCISEKYFAAKAKKSK